ncbi:hypothetical protein SBA3_3740005 [Candidatus Sulfopaludibacter sp. SbA3]|nr:hypothetical protein SBA3_3740005 [Candidatus Sulfopaludibacter sp. SbA3]
MSLLKFSAAGPTYATPIEGARGGPEWQLVKSKTSAAGKLTFCMKPKRKLTYQSISRSGTAHG